MIKCAGVYTYEIDDPETALGELKRQIEKKIPLLKHTVGIVMCHTEFIGSGTLRYISENMPFELAGVTTSSQAVNDEAGELILTVFIMTSDDVWFKTGVTGSLSGDIDGPLYAAYEKTSRDEPGAPGLAIIFPPLILEYAGDAYVNAWSRIIPGTPVFGAIPYDDTLKFENSDTIYNGSHFKTAMSYILCYGNVQPRFLVGTLPEDNILPYKSEITKSEGPFVYEINNANAYKYFENIGFAGNGAFVEYYLFVPFAIEQKKRGDYDGIPVIRGYASFTEDGTAIFRGDMDEGSTLTMLKCAPEDVLSTTRQKVGQVNCVPNVNGILMFPCIVRRMMTLRIDPLAELNIVKDLINTDLPFMMGYVGGEICPTSVRDGIPTNRFHNYSLVILIL